MSSPDDDTPLRLKDAVRLAYPLGGMTVSGLRKEAARNRLVIERVAGRLYTTLGDIRRMRELCRVPQKVLGSTYEQRGAQPALTTSSSTPCLTPVDDMKRAQDAAQTIVEALKQGLPPT